MTLKFWIVIAVLEIAIIAMPRSNWAPVQLSLVQWFQQTGMVQFLKGREG